MQEKIKEGIKEALRAHETVRLGVLRDLLAKFTNELVAKGRKPTERLTEEECLAVIRRASRQRKDSIEQFTKGGRADLAEIETAELRIIEEFLPAQMPAEEIRAVILRLLKENPALRGGQLMGLVMRELNGKAEGTEVQKMIKVLSAQPS